MSDFQTQHSKTLPEGGGHGTDKPSPFDRPETLKSADSGIILLVVMVIKFGLQV